MILLWLTSGLSRRSAAPIYRAEEMKDDCLPVVLPKGREILRRPNQMRARHKMAMACERSVQHLFEEGHQEVRTGRIRSRHTSCSGFTSRAKQIGENLDCRTEIIESEMWIQHSARRGVGSLGRDEAEDQQFQIRRTHAAICKEEDFQRYESILEKKTRKEVEV